eukprot:363769-Chlamydomonas_euryale.AAC.12
MPLKMSHSFSRHIHNTGPHPNRRASQLPAAHSGVPQSNHPPRIPCRTHARIRPSQLRGYGLHSCADTASTAARIRPPQLRRYGLHSCADTASTAARIRPPQLRGYGLHSCADTAFTAARIWPSQLRGYGLHSCASTSTMAVQLRHAELQILNTGTQLMWKLSAAALPAADPATPPSSVDVPPSVLLRDHTPGGPPGSFETS